MANTEKETEVISDQFKRNLDHIRIGDAKGPELTIGDITLQFRRKAPVKALAALIGNDNRVDGMTEYIKRVLVKGQDEEFDALLEDIDIDGLGEILSALGEGYTSFPAQS